ncbi:MAG: AbrB/MazE/SpoVT family DNA-binding domain-containing protein [Nitrososphaerales archaeon]|nr:AbrB/MazE/SpoVT family DNA-binding domain-containing protein [Nitrososphaerales archaeon]
MKTAMSEDAIVGKRFAIVVPKRIREKLRLEEGQRVMVLAAGDDILIRPLPKDPYESLRRIIREPYDEKRDEKLAEEWLKKHAGA